MGIFVRLVPPGTIFPEVKTKWKNKKQREFRLEEPEEMEEVKESKSKEVGTTETKPETLNEETKAKKASSPAKKEDEMSDSNDKDE